MIHHETDSAPTMGRATLSRLSGCNAETILYYERIGILPPPPRAANGYRVYGTGHLDRLTFVRKARDLGFSLDEVRSLLGLNDPTGMTCAQVHDIAVEHLASVRTRIADLRRVEATLAKTVAQCTGAAVPDCAVIDALSDKTAGPAT